MPILTDEELREALAARPGWRRQGGGLIREHVFRDYAEALAFLERVGRAAEDYFRHPDVAVIDGNRVRITVANANNAGLTDAELRLAAKVDEVTARPDVPTPEADPTPAGGRTVSGPDGLAAFPPPAGVAGAATAPEARTGPVEDARTVEGADLPPGAGPAAPAGAVRLADAEPDPAPEPEPARVGPVPLSGAAEPVADAVASSGPVVPVAIAAFAAGAVFGVLLRRSR